MFKASKEYRSFFNLSEFIIGNLDVPGQMVEGRDGYAVDTEKLVDEANTSSDVSRLIDLANYDLNFRDGSPHDKDAVVSAARRRLKMLLDNKRLDPVKLNALWKPI